MVATREAEVGQRVIPRREASGRGRRARSSAEEREGGGGEQGDGQDAGQHEGGSGYRRHQAELKAQLCGGRDERQGRRLKQGCPDGATGPGRARVEERQRAASDEERQQEHRDAQQRGGVAQEADQVQSQTRHDVEHRDEKSKPDGVQRGAEPWPVGSSRGGGVTCNMGVPWPYGSE